MAYTANEKMIVQQIDKNIHSTICTVIGLYKEELYIGVYKEGFGGFIYIGHISPLV